MCVATSHVIVLLKNSDFLTKDSEDKMFSSMFRSRLVDVEIAKSSTLQLHTLPKRFLSSSNTTEHDVAVLGGGPGGYVAAIKAAQLGLKVTCIEKRGRLGGTCLNVGCIPSKALLNSSHMYEEALHSFAGHGITFKDVKLDLDAMMKQKSKAVDVLTKGVEGLFRKNKVSYVRGTGKLKSKNEILVELLDGGTETIKAKNIVIAAGSESASLPGVAFDEKRVVSSTGALSLGQVPKRMVVIGGGYIGLEMGSVWRRLGSEVTVLEYLDHIVPMIDREVADHLYKTLQKQNLKFKLGTKVVGVDSSGSTLKLTVEPSKGGKQENLECDVVLVATGRKPNTGELGLDIAGVKLNSKGDLIRGPMLAHKAEDEGVACAEIIAGKPGHVNYDVIPSVIYTFPEVASVGKTEEELKQANIEYNKGVFPFLANSRARTNDSQGESIQGMVKVLADKKTDRILGIHIIGSNAGEMIAEGALAMEYGASSEDVARTCHAHPTLSEAFREAHMAAFSKPINF
ncbi:Dihydrolipoyl dehydrogenase, mitochondrial [Galdieria sulphuraria]|nr:Dihydrolipoyl dehydrogenase, mitochondrial [Galdieria sulphuraria]